MLRAVTGSGLMLLAITVLSPLALAECQDITYPGGHYRSGCDQATAKDGPWWASNEAQTAYWVIGSVAATGSFVFGVTRVRRRRRELRTFLDDVEATYAAAKLDPDTGLPKLQRLHDGLRASHARGRLEDGQFLELDKRLADYVTRVRLVQLERAFPHLPAALFGEIRNVLQDGALSATDLGVVEKRALALDIPVGTRRDLLAWLQRWGDGATVATPAKRRIAVVSQS